MPWCWWHPAGIQRVQMVAPTCSRVCAELLAETHPARRPMIDANEVEERAMIAAGYAGGDYIEAQKTSDMRRWTPQIWKGFISAVVGAYVEHLCKEQADALAALERVRSPGSV